MNEELMKKITEILASAKRIDPPQALEVTPTISISGDLIVGGDLHIAYSSEIPKLIRINDKDRPST